VPNLQWPSAFRALRLFAYLALVALLVSVLSLAQSVVLPLAVPAMLSFILSTPVAPLVEKLTAGGADQVGTTFGEVPISSPILRSLLAVSDRAPRAGQSNQERQRHTDST
jgi:hypothetical protein